MNQYDYHPMWKWKWREEWENTTVPEKEDKAEAKKVKLYESGSRLGKTFNKTLVLNFSISQQTSN